MSPGFLPIAIVGRSCVLPGALDPEALGRAVLEGRDLVSNAPEGRWGLDRELALADTGGGECRRDARTTSAGGAVDRGGIASDGGAADCGAGVPPAFSAGDVGDRAWCDRGGYVRGFEELFDPTGFALPAEEILALDPLFQWVFHTGREALRGLSVDRQRTGVVLGNLSLPALATARFAEAVWRGDEATRPHPRHRFFSGLSSHLLARALGLGGGAFSLDAACASSLYTLKLACDRLHDGTADAMLAGAVSAADDLFLHVGFSALEALSPSGQSRPFHRGADGLLPAEGAAFVVLKRLDDAIAAGERILGVIRAVGLSNDGRSRGLLAPSEQGQVRAIRRAYELAGLAPRDVSLVECHATGTRVGDATEIRSLSELYAGLDGVPLGSLKSNLGHLITAAGMAGLLKILAAIEARTRPPTLHAEEPNPELAGSPFRLLTEAEPWPAGGPRRAALSAFGFGGNNAHVLVEEWDGVTRPPRAPTSLAEPSAEIAVTGLAVLAADGEGVDDFASTVFSGESRAVARESVVLPLGALRFPPRDLEQTLPQQLLLLQAALQAVDETPELPAERTAVLVGMACDAEVARWGLRWRLGAELREPETLATARDGVVPMLRAAGVVGTMPNVCANRLNSQLDLGGPSFTVSSEELSGVVALRLARRALAAGEIDAAVVGAVDLSCEPVHAAAAQELLPEDRRTPGDAAVVLVLERLDDARRRGRRVYAVLTDDAADADDLRLGLGGDGLALTSQLGHAHAASGLLHTAAAALACHYRAEPRGAGRPARPWLRHDRRARVGVTALEGQRSSVRLRPDFASRPGSLAPAGGFPRLELFSGADRHDVLRRLGSGDASPSAPAPARLVIVASNEAERRTRREEARRFLAGEAPAGPGLHFRDAPVGGELAFVFTGGAAAYAGMGRDLLLGMPELADALGERTTELGNVAGWAYNGGPSPERGGRGLLEKLWGCSFLCQIHAQLSRGVLGLRPRATLGYSSGESNALMAMGAWNDFDALYRDTVECGLFTHQLGGDFSAVRRAWDIHSGNGRGLWANWVVAAPSQRVRDVIGSEERVHLMIINSPGEVVIGGEIDGCRRVIEKLGATAFPLDYDMAVHCPEVSQVADAWLALHRRPTSPVEGVRFYTHATGEAFEPTEESAAQAILGQATGTVDFPRLVKRAYADGVRIFVEHGPRDLMSGWIRKILQQEEVDEDAYLAVALDRSGSGALAQAADAIAALLAAGVDVHWGAFAWPERPEASGPVWSCPAHWPPVRLPEAPDHEEAGGEFQLMDPAPWLPPVLDDEPVTAEAPAAEPIPAPAPAAATAQPAVAVSDHPVGAVHQRLVAVQQEYLKTQFELHQRFLALNEQALATLRSAYGQTATAAPPSTPAPSPRLRAGDEPALPGPKFSRQQLEILASGKISTVYGPLFERQDGYHRQVRMPEPPLLLADRVTGIEGEPGVFGRGTIRTETDVRHDSWYLHHGRMPGGIMIESGQADLLLISWQGIDFLNRSEKVYRLLGCELTYHGPLPKPGDTLCYDIHIDGHAEAEARLFFFHYDCRIKGPLGGDRGGEHGERRLSVRHGQAGFFTDEDLAGSAGVLWTPEENPPEGGRVDPPRVSSIRSSFSRDDVVAFSEGRIRDALGPELELTRAHVRTPRIQSGDMLLFHEVTHLDVSGGPWQRGYLRARLAVAPEDWFFKGHFKNDPCMPGTLMFEGCLQTLAFYLTAHGFTLDNDGYRFEPVPGKPYLMRCRGQVIPSTRELVYEVFVREVIDGPEPTLFADLLCTADGLKAFHAENVGLRLVPDWPLTSRPHYLENVRPAEVAATRDGFRFDYPSLLACAWGQPSTAFGEMYRRFDGPRRVARLPGPPYHFMTRIVEADPDAMGRFEPGAVIVAEYDVPENDWYFRDNGFATMPFTVLLEAALQPCGWLASYVGSTLTTDEDLRFRNLDGTGTLHTEILPAAGTLRTRVRIVGASSSGGSIIERFEVECRIGEQPVYTMQTVFGFFPEAALAQQVGLSAGPGDPPEPGELGVDLTSRPQRYFGGSARMADGRLLMIDRVTRYWPTGGAAGRGRMVAEKDVDAGEWFFKAHFFQDPVQPGSLGIEAMIQLLQFYMLHTGMGRELEHPRFEPLALERPLTWKYRGQVLPTNKLVTVDLDVVETGSDERGVYAVADASLRVDGMRIYSATGLALRLVPGPPPSKKADEIVFDPEVDRWLGDHRPTWTVPALPMMSIADLLASAARSRHSGLEVVGVEDLRVRRWIVFPGGPTRLKTEITAQRRGSQGETELEMALHLLGEPATGGLAATGRVILSPTYPTPSSPVAPLQDASPAEDPYTSGALFHGPSFHLLRQLEVGAAGATGRLDAAAGAVPLGTLHPGLLDAGTHLIPHDELERWSPEIAAGLVAYPHRVAAVRFFGPPPAAGDVQCEARFEGFASLPDDRGPDPRRPVFLLQWTVGERLWAELRLEEILLPKGRLGSAPPADRRAFLRDGVAVPGLSLSRCDEEATRLSVGEVASSNWLPGTIAEVYRVADRAADHRTLTRQVAVKEHVARRAGVHPRTVAVDDDSGAPASLPLTRFPVTLAQERGEVTVTDAGGPRLETGWLRDFWRDYLGIGPWPTEDVYLGLIERFVERVIVVDPDALEALRGRPALFLANHQVGIESLLFSIIAGALVGSPLVTVAKAEHRATWLGRLIRHCFSYPGVTDPGVIAYFERDDKSSLPGIIRELGRDMVERGKAVMVHVEGTRALTCRHRVRALAGPLLDMALQVGASVVPVRFTGGLPVEPLEKRLEYPVGYGRQEYWIGRPISPQELEVLPYKERRTAILDALNGLGPAAEEEFPSAPDPELTAEIGEWIARTGARPEYAVIFKALERMAQPGPDVRKLLAGAREGSLALSDDASGPWLAELARWLYGPRGPQVF